MAFAVLYIQQLFTYVSLSKREFGVFVRAYDRMWIGYMYFLMWIDICGFLIFFSVIIFPLQKNSDK